MSDPRPVDDLLAEQPSAWPEISGLLDSGAVSGRVLEAEPRRARRVVYRLQVGVGSTLGALAAHTGGVLVDHGWLRLLGSGAAGLPDLAVANELTDPSDAQLETEQEPESDWEQSSPGGRHTAPGTSGWQHTSGWQQHSDRRLGTAAGPGLPPIERWGKPRLVIGYDVLGGSFAVTGDPLHGTPGHVCYWAPDTLSWEPLGMTPDPFLRWALTGGLDGFYDTWRWPGWQDEVSALAPGDGIATYPWMCTAEGKDLSQVGRRPVPLLELLALHADLARQLNETSHSAWHEVRLGD